MAITIREVNVPAIEGHKEGESDTPYRDPKCYSCLPDNGEANVCEFMCLDCECYFCVECLEMHESHRYISREYTTENILSIIQDITDEEFPDEKFMTEKCAIVDRVNVKHDGVDESDCSVTGVCVLNDRRVLICDYNNQSIKLFSANMYQLKRYFVVSSQPWDIIELQNYSVNESCDSAALSTDKKETTTPITDIQTVQSSFSITFTCIFEKQITIANVNESAITVREVINTRGYCSGIATIEDKILAVIEDPLRDLKLSVSIYTTKGILVNIVNTDIGGMNSYLTILPGTDSFIISRFCDTIQRVSFTGDVLAEYSEENWRPEGVCVGEKEHVYVCAVYKHAVCKMPWDLSRCETLTRQDSSRNLYPVVISRDKANLIISHESNTQFGNFITKIQTT